MQYFLWLLEQLGIAREINPQQTVTLQGKCSRAKGIGAKLFAITVGQKFW